MPGAERCPEGDELQKNLRSDLEARVARDEGRELFLLFRRHQLNRIVVSRESTQNIYERVSGYDGFVRLVEVGLRVVFE